MGGSLEESGRSYGALRRQNGLDLKCGGSETSWGPGRLLWQVSVLALGEFGRPSTSLEKNIVYRYSLLSSSDIFFLFKELKLSLPYWLFFYLRRYQWILLTPEFT